MSATRARFPRACRLLNSTEFDHVFANARRANGRNFLLLARPTDHGSARLGLAVAKKHAKRSVDRNRIKRQVRESFRLHRHMLNGLDIIFLSRPGLGSIHSAELRRSLEGLWARLLDQCDNSSSAS